MAQPDTSGEGRIPLRVGLESGAAPFTFLDTNGRPAGFCVALLDAIAEENEFSIEYVVRPWADVMSMLQHGEIDVIANIGYLPERATQVDFTIPHASLPGAIFVQKREPRFLTRRELSAKTFAVGRESFAHRFAVANGLGENLVFIPHLHDCLEQLNQGKVGAVIATEPIAMRIVRDHRFANVKRARTDLPPLTYELHMAVRKGRTDLLHQLNMALHRTHTDGTYEALYERWVGSIERPGVDWRGLRPYWIPLAVLGLVLTAFLIQQRGVLRRFKRQAEELRHNEERLSLVLEGSKDAFWDWDLQTDQVIRSARWAEILGYTPGEIDSHIDGLKRWMHGEDLAAVEKFKNRTRSGHGKVEYRVKAKDGTWRWFFDRGSVVARGPNGDPLRVTGVATDITQRKQTEAALVRLQNLLEQTQETTQIGGWEYDLRSGTLFWTRQTYRIHELDPELPVSNLNLERMLSFFTAAARPAINQAMERLLREGASFDLELELTSARGHPVWVRVVGRADRDDAHILRLHGSYQDISREKLSQEERQKLQLKMLEAQKLESLGVLAGGIAHDFNNLLTIILGNASLAREDQKSVAEALDQIEIASQRAADLCRQMLAYAGKSRFSIETFDLNRVVSDTVQLLRLSISKSARLDFVLCQKALPLKADPSQIRQVIMNLVINASEALGGGNGQIRVVTTQMNVTRELLKEARLGQDLPAGEYVGVEIEDNGCGMSRETLARIFDPFFTTKFTGRGLGLAAVVGVVRAHQGALFVTSTLARGSTFRILFPRAVGAIVPKAEVTVPRRTEAHGTVLVVDDEPNVRRVASTILERNGYTVAVAADGYEALALGLAHGGRFGAVLLDLTMPGLDGPSTLKELRSMNPTLPVLIMSGFSEDDARRRLPGDALVSFLPKPFSTEDLLRALHSLRERAAATSSAAPQS